MSKFEKKFVGNGRTPVKGWSVTRITLNMEELSGLAYEFKGRQYVTLEVAPLKRPDSYGRTHTVYGSVQVE